MIGRWGLALLTLAADIAAAPVYTGALAVGRWEVQSSPLACELSQPLPRGGQARLIAQAGGLFSVVLPLEPGQAQIRVSTPIWREAERSGTLGVWQSEELTGAVFDAVLRELANGYHVEIAASAPVQLSTVGFRGPFAEFQQCRAQLLPLRFADIERSKVLYGAGASDELSPAARATLDMVAAWAAADDALSAVVIDGHTDTAGTRVANLELSKRRAQGVAQYLRERGAPDERILVRWHGERYPLGGGAAADRRVTVRLERYSSSTPGSPSAAQTLSSDPSAP